MGNKPVSKSFYSITEKCIESSASTENECGSLLKQMYIYIGQSKSSISLNIDKLYSFILAIKCLTNIKPLLLRGIDQCKSAIMANVVKNINQFNN